MSTGAVSECKFTTYWSFCGTSQFNCTSHHFMWHCHFYYSFRASMGKLRPVSPDSTFKRGSKPSVSPGLWWCHLHCVLISLPKIYHAAIRFTIGDSCDTHHCTFFLIKEESLVLIMFSFTNNTLLFCSNLNLHNIYGVFSSFKVFESTSTTTWNFYYLEISFYPQQA